MDGLVDWLNIIPFGLGTYTSAGGGVVVSKSEVSWR